MSAKIRILIFTALLCLNFPAMGRTAEFLEGMWNVLGVETEELSGVLGLGVMYAQRPYEGVDDDVWPVPVVSLEYKGLFIKGKEIGYTVNHVSESQVKFAIVGEPRLMGYDDEDSSALTGMNERDSSFDAGFKVSWLNDLFNLNITALSDIANAHQRQEVKAYVSKTFKEGFFTPRFGVKWYSEDIVDYYFGVLGHEYRPTRPNYEGESTFNFGLGGNIAIPIGEKWAVTADVEYTFLGDEIKDSPIVDADGTLFSVLGLVYRY